MNFILCFQKKIIFKIVIQDRDLFDNHTNLEFNKINVMK